MSVIEDITSAILHTPEEDMTEAEKHYAEYFLAIRAIQAYRAHLPQVRENWIIAADAAREASRGLPIEEKLAAGRAAIAPYVLRLKETEKKIAIMQEIADREYDAYQVAKNAERE